MSDRAVYGTRKHRARDLEAGDVTRNRYGKWDVVVEVTGTPAAAYVDVQHEVGGVVTLRAVHLVDVQVVRPS